MTHLHCILSLAMEGITLRSSKVCLFRLLTQVLRSLAVLQQGHLSSKVAMLLQYLLLFALPVWRPRYAPRSAGRSRRGCRRRALGIRCLRETFMFA
jgi:hypothetical protein